MAVDNAGIRIYGMLAEHGWLGWAIGHTEEIRTPTVRISIYIIIIIGSVSLESCMMWHCSSLWSFLSVTNTTFTFYLLRFSWNTGFTVCILSAFPLWLRVYSLKMCKI